MKILITTSSFDSDAVDSIQRLRAAGIEIVMNPHGRRLSESDVAALMDERVVGMVAGVEPLTRSVLARAKNLRVLSRCGIGLDSVDLDAAREFGIKVCNTPEAPSLPVAELTLAMMLNVLRRISEADREIRLGNWKPLMGGLLHGRTVGLIGCGRIGRRVSQLARAFGAHVMACDSARPALDSGVVACDLDRLLAAADIVSLHIPYTDSNRHLLNAARLAAMKPGAILINVSRGGLVDEAALLAALEAGHLAGAALDAFEQEPYKGPLAAMPQVLLTAHMGSYAKEARVRMELEAGDNLLRGLAECGVVSPGVASERPAGDR